MASSPSNETLGAHSPGARSSVARGATDAARRVTDPSGRAEALGRCGECGYLGQGIPYFRRTGHAAVLVVAALLTYGIAALVFWVLKRDDRICPECGRSWERYASPTIPGAASGVPEGSNLPQRASLPEGSGVPESAYGSHLPPPPTSRMDWKAERLPGSGTFRRVVGFVFAVAGLVVLAVGLLELEAWAIYVGTLGLLAGAASYEWGRRSLRARRSRILESLQARALYCADRRGGRVTATEIARDLDLTLDAADNLLFSMEDGLRVRCEVTDEGLLVFDFPEIRLSHVVRLGGTPGTEAPGRTSTPSISATC